MSKTTHYELNTPIGSEVLSVMTGLNPNFNTIDETMYDNETRSTQALNKANVNEQNIATALGRITTAEGDIDTLETDLQTANTNISGLTSRMGTAENNIVSANNRIHENTTDISEIKEDLSKRALNPTSRNVVLDFTNNTGTSETRNYTVAEDGFYQLTISHKGGGYCYGAVAINGIPIFSLDLNANVSENIDTVFYFAKGTVLNGVATRSQIIIAHLA